jgi:hypothetical protein
MSAPLPLTSNNPPVCPVQQNLSDAEYAIDAEICQLLALKQQARQKQRRHSQNMALQQLAARLQAAGPTSNLLHDLHNALQMQDVALQMALQQEQRCGAGAWLLESPSMCWPASNAFKLTIAAAAVAGAVSCMQLVLTVGHQCMQMPWGRDTGHENVLKLWFACSAQSNYQQSSSSAHACFCPFNEGSTQHCLLYPATCCHCSATASEQSWGASAAFSPGSVMTSAAPAATAAAVSRPGTGSRASIDMGPYYQQNVAVSPFAAGAAGITGPLQQCSMALAAAADALSMPFGGAMTPDQAPYASAAAPVQVDLGLDLAAVLNGLSLQNTNLLLSPQQSYGSALPAAGLPSFAGGLSPAQSFMQGLQGTSSSSSALLMPAAASSFDFAPSGPPAGAQAYYNPHSSDVLQAASGVLDCTVLDPANGSARGLYSQEGRMQAAERARTRRHSMHLPGSYMTPAQHAGGAGATYGGLGPAAWVQEGQSCNAEQQDAAVGPACRPFGATLSPAEVELLPMQTGAKNRRHSVHLAGVNCMPAPHSSGMSAQSSMSAQWAGAAAHEAFAGHAGSPGMQVSTASNRACRTSMDVTAAPNAAPAAAAAVSGVSRGSTRQPGGNSRQFLEVRPSGVDRSGRQFLDVTGSTTARCSMDLPAKFAAPKWADASWHPKAAAAAAAGSGAGGSSQHTKGTGVFMPRMAA